MVAGDAVLLHDAAGATHRGAAWLVPSGVRHRLEPCARLALLLVEPGSHFARALQRSPVGGIVAAPDAATAMLDDGPLSSGVARFADALGALAHDGDERLALALDAMARGEGVEAAARRATLSPSRLRELAKRELGVPLARVVVWRKVRLACRAMQAGASLAEAAADAGFADQAHLTRTMAAVIGLTPGEALAAAR